MLKEVILYQFYETVLTQLLSKSLERLKCVKTPDFTCHSQNSGLTLGAAPYLPAPRTLSVTVLFFLEVILFTSFLFLTPFQLIPVMTEFQKF